MIARLKNTAIFGTGLLCSLGLLTPITAQQQVTILKGARILPVSSKPIDNGVVVMFDGKIQLIGNAETPIPDGALVIDCKGKVLTPGLVDAGTMIGVSADNANEQHEEVTPHMHVLDAVDPTDKRFERVRRQGVTTVQVNPGTRNVIGGMGVVLKTRGDTVREMLVRNESGLRMVMGSDPSAGNRAIRGGTPNSFYYRRPTTRMGVVWESRKAFYAAMDYREKKTIPGQDPADVPSDVKLDVLVRALDRKILVHTTARAEQDIRTALRLAKEFGYETLIEEASEAWRVIDELKEAGVKVLLRAPKSLRQNASSSSRSRGFGFSRGDGEEDRFHTFTLLSQAGIPYAIHTGSDLGSLHLVHAALFAVRHGLTEEQALAAITKVPAEILGISDRVGSLSAGLDADLVLWSASPFDPASRVEAVYIEGVEVSR